LTTEVLSATLTAGVQSTFGQGRIWYLKVATGAMTVIAEKLGTGGIVRRFINVGAGFKFKAEEGAPGWDYLRVTSPTTQNIEIIIGDDDVEVANAVSITGAATILEQPSATIATPDDVAVATVSNSDIAANPARRRITIGALSTNADPLPLRVRTTAGTTGAGIELQAGTFVELKTTSAIRVRNPGAVSQSYWILEET